MKTIETTAEFEDEVHLRLAEPLASHPRGKVKIILVFDDSSVAGIQADDPFYTLPDIAEDIAPLTNREIDQLVYGA